MKTLEKRSTKTKSVFGYFQYLYLWVIAIVLMGCASVQPEVPTSEVSATAIIAETPVAEGETVAEETIPTPEGEDDSSNIEMPISSNNNEVKVAVLVVDFFGTPNPEEGGSGNCAASPYGYASEGAGGGHGSTGATGDLVSTTVPHGRLVYQHIAEQFGTDFEEIPSPDIEGLVKTERAIVDPADGSTVYLVQIDIGKNLTGAVAGRILEVRRWLKKAERVDSFVVNMSIVVVPCQPVIAVNNDNAAQYLQFVRCIVPLRDLRLLLNVGGDNNEPNPELDESLRPLIELVAAYFVNPHTGLPYGCPGDPDAVDQEGPGNPQNRIPRILNSLLGQIAEFYASLNSDPLQDFLANLATNNGEMRDTFFIAAAGNQGYPYPYAPAIFLDVVSTGSIAPGSEQLRYPPNLAEWRLNDRFKWDVPVTVTVTITTPGGLQDVSGMPVTVSGSSFAAAKMSYLTAMALFEPLSSLPECYPRMVYAAANLPPGWSLSQAVTKPGIDIWENKRIDRILEDCVDFPILIDP